MDLQGASGFSHARTRHRCGLQNGDACTRSIQSPRVKTEAKEVFENVRSKIRLQLHIRLTGRQTPGGLSAGRCCPDVRVRTRISFLLTFTEMFRNARRENLSRVLTYTRAYKNNKYTHAGQTKRNVNFDLQVTFMKYALNTIKCVCFMFIIASHTYHPTYIHPHRYIHNHTLTICLQA